MLVLVLLRVLEWYPIGGWRRVEVCPLVSRRAACSTAACLREHELASGCTMRRYGMAMASAPLVGPQPTAGLYSESSVAIKWYSDMLYLTVQMYYAKSV